MSDGWVIENGNNNVLKTKGYHLEHNFGHGDQNLSTMLAAMNILPFLLHTVLSFTDANYKLVREELPSRETFFQHVTSAILNMGRRPPPHIENCWTGCQSPCAQPYACVIVNATRRRHSRRTF